MAEALGARLFDIDQLLVREMGMPVAQIFGMVGEPRFREMEHKAVQAAVAAEEPAVIVPGGGWAAQPGHMHWAGSRAVSVSISAASPRQRRNGRIRARLDRFSWGTTRWGGCGSSSSSGNRFTSSPILRWRRSRMPPAWWRGYWTWPAGTEGMVNDSWL